MKSKKIKGLILLVFFLINLMCPNLGVAQNPPLSNSYAPSPDAAAMIKTISSGINESIGVANVNVPLLTLPANGGVSVNVSINYVTSGIKVQELASVVGTGWNLVAGGSITRVINSYPDLSDRSNIASQLDAGQGNWYDRDLAPDFFYFSFLGRSGRFYLNNNAQPFTQPYQDLDISFTTEDYNSLFVSEGIENSFDEWVITDESGYKYVFGENEQKEETQVYNGPNAQDHFASEYFKFNYVSTWHLTSVISPHGEELLTFEYSSSGLVEQTSEANRVIKNLSTDTDYDFVSSLVYNQHYPKFISSIESEYGHLVFRYEDDRLDIVDGKRLEQIVLYDDQFDFVESIMLEHDYFRGINSRYTDLTLTQEYVDQYLGGESPVYRLALESVQQIKEKKRDIARFSYNREIELPLIPDGGHYQINKFGYSTNAAQYTGYNLIPNGLEVHYGGNTWTINNGFDRDMYFDHIKANILTEVHYPNGLTKRFEYGHSDHYSKRIRVDSEIYLNSDEEELNRVDYEYQDEYTDATIYFDHYSENGSGDKIWTIFSNPLRQFDENVYYGRVVKRRLDGTVTISEYDITPDINPQIYRYVNGNYNNTFEGSASFTRSAKLSSQHWKRGKILNRNKYAYYVDEVDNYLIKSLKYTYDAIPSEKDVTIAYHPTNGSGGLYSVTNGAINVGEEEYISSADYLVSVEETSFGQEDLTKKTVYEVSSDYLNVTSSRVFINEEERFRTNYQYVSNLNWIFSGISLPLFEAKVITEMRLRHIHNALIEETQIDVKEGKLIASKVNTYKEVNDKWIRPKAVYIFDDPIDVNDDEIFSYVESGVFYRGHDDFEAVTTYGAYDANSGNLLTTSDQYSTEYQNIWDEDYKYVEATIANANLDEVRYSSFESHMSGWESTDGVYYDEAKTGDESIGCTDLTTTVDLPAGKYRVSLCSKYVSGNASLVLNGGVVFLPGTSEWNCETHIVTLATSGGLSFASTSEVLIDELRVVPYDASISSQSYEPFVGVTSETDANMITTYHEYNSFGEYKLTRDDDGNIIASTSTEFQDDNETENICISSSILCGPDSYSPAYHESVGGCVEDEVIDAISFKVSTDVTEGVNYQWQYSTGGILGLFWYSTGSNSPILDLYESTFLPVLITSNILKVRCILTDACGNITYTNIQIVYVN